MGRAGLLGAAVPVGYAGAGCGYRAVGVIGRELTRRGGCLGLTLSWVMHQIVCRFVFAAQANDDQKRTCLPRLASGEITASLAISEPGAGAHPKHLKTSARRVRGGYVIEGEKSFITNGPIARLFVTVAVSGMEGTRKLFSAFLVPSDREGLRVGPVMDVGFLRPCPHCTIELDGCVVAEGELLGRPGAAYDDMVLPFRDVEDVSMMGPIAGAQEARMGLLARALRGVSPHTCDRAACALGEIAADTAAMRVLADEAAFTLDSRGRCEDLTTLVIAFRRLVETVHRGISQLASCEGVVQEEPLRTLGMDTERLTRFAGKVMEVKKAKIGRRLVDHPGHP